VDVGCGSLYGGGAVVLGSDCTAGLICGGAVGLGSGWSFCGGGYGLLGFLLSGCRLWVVVWWWSCGFGQ
jgi:hypothetical protein